MESDFIEHELWYTTCSYIRYYNVFVDLREPHLWMCSTCILCVWSLDASVLYGRAVILRYNMYRFVFLFLFEVLMSRISAPPPLFFYKKIRRYTCNQLVLFKKKKAEKIKYFYYSLTNISLNKKGQIKQKYSLNVYITF